MKGRNKGTEARKRTSNETKPPVATVLIVCNISDTGAIWSLCLRQKNMKVILETSMEYTRDRIVHEIPDMVVLDITGSRSAIMDLVKSLRLNTVAPILLLTHETDEKYMLDAYAAGVDECIQKPISPMMFQAKMKAWLRHSRTTSLQALIPIRVGSCSIDPATRSITMGEDAPLRLTALEFRLLYALMGQPDRPLSAEELIEHMWGYDGTGDNVILKNVVYRLRRKVEKDRANPEIIKTVPGIGYKFVSW